ncbi:hypothetical protein EGR_08307 [Echinococcus granulosus]|uniref:Uncharacterized protein n=1 Tax=Echinococcus granulosus TaxID=6210 RepID=W6U6H5_ECHGR|nr:hypothetical protein EGR_08307 [Echinococcus granulosus]EUB56838.1 hypothetical protein EGR_08307 [Echinococcus granulosus]
MVVARLSECCGSFYSTSRQRHYFRIHLTTLPSDSMCPHSPIRHPAPHLPSFYFPFLPLSTNASVISRLPQTHITLIPPLSLQTSTNANASLLITTTSTRDGHDPCSTCNHSHHITSYLQATWRPQSLLPPLRFTANDSQCGRVSSSWQTPVITSEVLYFRWSLINAALICHINSSAPSPHFTSIATSLVGIFNCSPQS